MYPSTFLVWIIGVCQGRPLSRTFHCAWVAFLSGANSMEGLELFKVMGFCSSIAKNIANQPTIMANDRTSCLYSRHWAAVEASIALGLTPHLALLKNQLNDIALYLMWQSLPHGSLFCYGQSLANLSTIIGNNGWTRTIICHFWHVLKIWISKNNKTIIRKMVSPTRIELATQGLEDPCSSKWATGTFVNSPPSRIELLLMAWKATVLADRRWGHLKWQS